MALSPNEMSLKATQLKAVYRMLAFNEDAGAYEDDFSLPPAGSSHNQWKILIYDAPCRSIISPLLSVSQLRRRGVTLHLMINGDREPIPDVPAIYFCRPTTENLAIIAQDCAKGLYSRCHVNFVTKLERSMMEEFAKLVVQSGSLNTIAGVHDQFLDFVCLERRLFSLHQRNSYALYNGSGANEEVIEKSMTEIAYGLFSVITTMGKVPIIRCPKNGAPEMVARKLSKLCSEHPTLQRNKSSLHRPLLVILDRNADLVTPIQHTSTYQALIDDVLLHRANRVEFEVTSESTGRRAQTQLKKFDLDPDEDPFYRGHKFQPFPEAIESNGIDLQDVTAKEHSIRSKAGGSSVPDPLASSATDLATAVDSLPALLDRKKQLEMHTSILQAVMNQVAARDIPQFFELESSLATGSYKTDTARAKSDVLALAADPSKGTVADTIRLLVVYILATNAKSSDVDEVTSAVQSAFSNAQNEDGKPLLDKEGADMLNKGMNAIGYLKQLRAMHMLPTSFAIQEMDTDASGQGKGSDILASFMAKATTQATGLLAKATDKVTSMLGKIHKHYATRAVENLCEMKPGAEDEEYLYLDPKVKGEVDVSKLKFMNRESVREVTVFVIGGGCYSEYQNLQMISSDQRAVYYGSTELLSADEFLGQLGSLS